MDALIELLPELGTATVETLYIVGLTLFFGGISSRTAHCSSP